MSRRWSRRAESDSESEPSCCCRQPSTLTQPLPFLPLVCELRCPSTHRTARMAQRPSHRLHLVAPIRTTRHTPCPRFHQLPAQPPPHLPELHRQRRVHSPAAAVSEVEHVDGLTSLHSLAGARQPAEAVAPSPSNLAVPQGSSPPVPSPAIEPPRPPSPPPAPSFSPAPCNTCACSGVIFAIRILMPIEQLRSPPLRPQHARRSSRRSAPRSLLLIVAGVLIIAGQRPRLSFHSQPFRAVRAARRWRRGAGQRR